MKMLLYMSSTVSSAFLTRSSFQTSGPSFGVCGWVIGDAQLMAGQFRPDAASDNIYSSNVEGTCNDGPVKSIPQYHSKTPRFKIVVGLRENSWPTKNINKTVQKNFVATGTATSCPWVPKVW